MAGAGVEYRVADGLERLARLVAEADANGVRPAVGDERCGRFDTVEDGGCVFGDLLWREAHACGELRVDFEVCRGAADRIVDAVFDVDYALDLLNIRGDARRELVEQGGVLREDFDLDGLGCIGEIADVVLQDLREFDVKLRLVLFDILAHVGDDLVDAATAMLLQLDGEVTGVGFGHRGQAHLQASPARGDLDLRCVVQDLLRS